MATMTQNDNRHILYWKRGEYGRGLFYEDTDTVVTWPEDEMCHDQRHWTLHAADHPCTAGGEYPTEFTIHMDGRLGQYCLSRQQAERVLELVPSLSDPSYWKA